MGFDVQTAKNPLASTLAHARTARTTLYAHNMHARRWYDVILHPHRMLALMTSLLMGRKATTKQTNRCITTLGKLFSPTLPSLWMVHLIGGKRTDH